MTHKRRFKTFVPLKHQYCYCSGKSKILYTTRDAALVARNKRRTVRLRVYECPYHAGWHLTSQQAL